MRITKLLFTFLALTFVTFTSTANNDPLTSSVRNEIKSIFEKADFEVQEDQRVLINFLINSKNEIIVISASDDSLEPSIRGILDLKKVSAADIVYNRLYTLPIQLKKM